MNLIVLHLMVGIPHGPILGPMLFLLQVNKLCSLLSNANVIMYADDTSLIGSNKRFLRFRNRQNSITY